MLPSRHPDAVDHFIGLIAMTVDDECSRRHPLETPVPDAAEHLIARPAWGGARNRLPTVVAGAVQA